MDRAKVGEIEKSSALISKEGCMETTANLTIKQSKSSEVIDINREKMTTNEAELSSEQLRVSPSIKKRKIVKQKRELTWLSMDEGAKRIMLEVSGLKSRNRRSGKLLRCKPADAKDDEKDDEREGKRRRRRTRENQNDNAVEKSHEDNNQTATVEDGEEKGDKVVKIKGEEEMPKKKRGRPPLPKYSVDTLSDTKMKIVLKSGPRKAVLTSTASLDSEDGPPPDITSQVYFFYFSIVLD